MFLWGAGRKKGVQEEMSHKTKKKKPCSKVPAQINGLILDHWATVRMH